MNVDQLLTELEARRHKALVAGVAVAAGSLLAAFLLIALLQSLPGESVLADLVVLLLISLLAGAPPLGLITYRKIAPTRGVLLWLRRFREGYGPRLRFHNVLAQACAGILHPVTIQDSSFRVSYMAATQTLWLALAFSVLAWFIGLLLTIVVFVALDILTVDSGPGTMLLALGAWTALFVWGLVALLKRFGVTELRGQAAHIEVANRLQSLRSGASSNVLAVEILKCHDAVWQDVVSEALSRTDLVLVDITDPTENIMWELAVALQRLGRERVILTMEEGTHLDPRGFRELPAELRDDVFVYPAVQGRPGLRRGSRYHSVAQQLRTEIVARLVLTPAARV